ncbi:helix-turn-helix domain-containing protein [Oleomonas cavernae]|nr:helix-turn-helix transcriptional regulator [Oleomonas cavernae]
MPMSPMDIQIGRRIRERRWLLGLSQEKLARRVGLKFQQVQKYETAGSKVSASRLLLIARALEVSVSYFYEGDAAAQGTDTAMSREAAEFAHYFMRLPEAQRVRLSELVRAMVAMDAAPAPAVAREKAQPAQAQHTIAA